MPKRGIVLAGGGARGAYQVGVWQALSQLNVDYQLVTGTSVGALNGAMMVQNRLDIACHMWQTISSSDVIKQEESQKQPSALSGTPLWREFLRNSVKNGGLDVTPLEKVLREVIDEDEVRNSLIDFALVTVTYPLLKPVEIGIEAIPYGMLHDYLMASACCFPAFKARQINKVEYIDGGFYDNMPINLAIHRGAEDIICVDLQSIGITKTVSNHQIPVKRISPHWDLGSFLVFDPATAKRNMVLGLLDTLKLYERLDGFAYSFERGHCRRNYFRYAQTLREVFAGLQLSGGRNKTQLEIAVKRSMLHYVEKHTGEKHLPSLLDFFIIAGETTAKAFELDPCITYTDQEFNRRLCEYFAACDILAIKQIPSLLKSPQNLELLTAELKKLNRTHVIGYLYNRIRYVLRKGDFPRDLMMIAAAGISEFIAAIYLVTVFPHEHKTPAIG